MLAEHIALTYMLIDVLLRDVMYMWLPIAMILSVSQFIISFGQLFLKIVTDDFSWELSLLKTTKNPSKNKTKNPTHHKTETKQTKTLKVDSS